MGRANVRALHIPLIVSSGGLDITIETAKAIVRSLGRLFGWEVFAAAMILRFLVTKIVSN